jgi:hypothetical protein
MRQGRSLEKLIAYLERHLATNDMVQVESPKRLRDISTGRLREHDVVLTIKSGHHTVLVAIECRDRSRPVGVPQIEAFAKKCQETGIGQGIVVAPRGFAKTALVKARALGIKCLSLDQVSNLPWMFAEHMDVYQTTYTHIGFTIIPENDFDRKPEDFTLVTDDGEAVTMDMLRGNILAALNDQQAPTPDALPLGEHTQRIRFPTKNLSVIDNANGQRQRVRHINTVIKSTTEKTRLPFALHEYRDPEDEACLAQLASANIDLGFTSGKFVITHRLETGGEIVFIPDDKKTPK